MARIELSNIGGGGTTLSLTTTGTSGASTLAGSVLNIPVYQGQLTLTTTGTSGAATLVGNTLNIPNYATGGSPAGSTGEIQYNNAGAFAASSNLAWDNSGSGRLNIGSAITTSARLGVRGASDLSGSFSLICSNNSGTEFFRVRNDGIVQARGNYINLGTDQNVGIGPTTNGGGFTSGGGDVVFAGSNGGVSNACAAFNIVGGRKISNSGVLWLNGGTFDPSSSSNTYSIIDITSSVVINQTGTASGITRGLYIRPTITSAADYRSIEWNNSAGYGLYGAGTASNYLAGNTVIGTTTSSARLHVRGSNASSGTNALLVQNSTPSDIYKIENDGKISYWATNTAAGTTGPQTIDRPSGTVNFGIGAGSLVVTNSLCTTSSIVFATVRTNDATAYIKNVVPAAGSFTINLGANATAETSVGFFIIN